MLFILLFFILRVRRHSLDSVIKALYSHLGVIAAVMCYVVGQKQRVI